MTKYIVSIRGLDPEEVFTKLKGLESIVILESVKGKDKHGFAVVETGYSKKTLGEKIGYNGDIVISKIIKYNLTG